MRIVSNECMFGVTWLKRVNKRQPSKYRTLRLVQGFSFCMNCGKSMLPFLRNTKSIKQSRLAQRLGIDHISTQAAPHRRIGLQTAGRRTTVDCHTCTCALSNRCDPQSHSQCQCHPSLMGAKSSTKTSPRRSSSMTSSSGMPFLNSDRMLSWQNRMQAGLIRFGKDSKLYWLEPRDLDQDLSASSESH